MASPGHRATVLVALASTGGTPTKSIMGNERKLPPPATAFSVPAITPVKNKRMACLKCKYQRIQGSGMRLQYFLAMRIIWRAQPGL